MTHYDAFISYNHNPRDNKITRMLQQKLENYTLPKGTAATSGKDKIERVFLDKGELEVAGDLNTIIQEALENSDHLIVVCSPESKKSIWVQREIEFFLRNHTIDDILTVITDGQPFDVLPDAVLFEEVDDGEGNIVKKSREPLSCDYRLPVRRAEREELPRLVAALLGCRYDDLVQRQRQYRMKRQISLLAAAAVLLSAAIGYLIWSNQKIKANYEQSMIEESLNLARQSQDALSRGDRLGAIRYALQALPSEDKDRPVVSEAVLALSEALDLYHSVDEEKWTAVKQFQSEMSCYDALAFMADGNEYIAARFSDGSVSICDSISGEELMSDYTEELSSSDVKIQEMHVTDDGTLLLISDTDVYALDVPAGKEKYDLTITLPSYPGSVSSTLYSSCCSGNDLWLAVYADITSPNDEDIDWFAETKYCFVHIDAKSGKVLNDLPPVEGYPDDMALSADGKYLACVFEINNFTESRLDLYDTETGEVQSLTRPQITDMQFDDSGRLIIAGCKERLSEYDYSTVPSSDYIRIGKEGTYKFTKYADRDLFVACLDAPSLNEIWNTDCSGYYCGMPALGSLEDKSGGDIVCTTGSTVMILSSSGSVTDQVEFRAPVIACNYSKESGGIKAILRDGGFAIYSRENGTIVSYENVFAENIREVAFDKDAPSGSLYILADNSTDSSRRTLTQYLFEGTDPEWKPYGQTIEYGDMAYAHGRASYGDCFIELRAVAGENSITSDESNVTRIISRKAVDGEVILDKVIPVPEGGSDSSLYYTYAGLDPESGKVCFIDSSYDHQGLLVIDAATGGSEYFSLELSDASSGEAGENMIFERYGIPDDISDFDGGNIYCPVFHSVAYEDDNTGEWIEEETLCVMEVGLDTGSCSLTPVMDVASEEGAPETAVSIIDAERELLIITGEDNTIRAYGFDGKLKWETDALPYEIMSLCMSDDGVMFAAEQTEPSKYMLHVIDSSDGKEIAATDIGLLSELSSSSGFSSYCEPVASGETLLCWGRYAFILDDSDWSLRARMRSFLVYNADTQLFILSEYSVMEGDMAAGCVPYRSLDDIIAAGHEALGE